MATKAAADEAAPQPRKHGRLVVVVAVVMLGVGALIGGKVLASPSDATAATTTTTEPPGLVTTIDSITLNLADGRFLKLGLAFEVREGEDYPREMEMEDEITKGFAREIDAAITLLAAYDFDTLSGPTGKAEAKNELLRRVQELSDDAIKNIYFHEFVMQ